MQLLSSKLTSLGIQGSLLYWRGILHGKFTLYKAKCSTPIISVQEPVISVTQTFIWWKCMAKELSKSRAGRNTNKIKSGLIPAPAKKKQSWNIQLDFHYQLLEEQALCIHIYWRKSNVWHDLIEDDHIHMRMLSPSTPNPLLVPYSAATTIKHPLVIRILSPLDIWWFNFKISRTAFLGVFR